MDVNLEDESVEFWADAVYCGSCKTSSFRIEAFLLYEAKLLVKNSTWAEHYYDIGSSVLRDSLLVLAPHAEQQQLVQRLSSWTIQDLAAIVFENRPGCARRKSPTDAIC